MIIDRFPSRHVTIFSVDVADEAACTSAVKAAIGEVGRPAWAIANAGIAKPGHFLEQRAADHVEQMATNYFGALNFARSVVPAMQEAGGGRLVFVSSGAALFGIYGYSAYAPSKFAMRGLAEILRVELAPHGIVVTVAYPPNTDTPQLKAEKEAKPTATRAITAGGGLWLPERIALKIVTAAEKNRFTVAPGVQMTLLAHGHSLLGPILRRYQAHVVRRHSR
jgi:3-dehydrosphinganine reductase